MGRGTESDCVEVAATVSVLVSEGEVVASVSAASDVRAVMEPSGVASGVASGVTVAVGSSVVADGKSAAEAKSQSVLPRQLLGTMVAYIQ